MSTLCRSGQQLPQFAQCLHFFQQPAFGPHSQAFLDGSG